MPTMVAGTQLLLSFESLPCFFLESLLLQLANSCNFPKWCLLKVSGHLNFQIHLNLQVHLQLKGFLQGRLPPATWLLVPEQEEEGQDSASYRQPQNNCFIIPDLPLTSMAVPSPTQEDGARPWLWARVHRLPIESQVSLSPFFAFFALSKQPSPNSNPPLSSGPHYWDIHC